MNGKMSKMLSRMRRDDKRSKKLFKSLDWKTKTKIRDLFKTNPKLVDVDQLLVVTGVSKSDLYPHLRAEAKARAEASAQLEQKE